MTEVRCWKLARNVSKPNSASFVLNLYLLKMRELDTVFIHLIVNTFLGENIKVLGSPPGFWWKDFIASFLHTIFHVSVRQRSQKLVLYQILNLYLNIKLIHKGMTQLKGLGSVHKVLNHLPINYRLVSFVVVMMNNSFFLHMFYYHSFGGFRSLLFFSWAIRTSVEMLYFHISCYLFKT